MASDELNARLSQTLDNERIEEIERGEAEERVDVVVNTIIDHLSANRIIFGGKAERLNIGSYYENLKLSNPDALDVMICIPAGRVNIQPFGKPGACYSVSLPQGNTPLRKFKVEIQGRSILSGYKMLWKFREEVIKKSLSGVTGWRVQRKKKGCPAVTLTTTQEPFISLNVVLSLKVDPVWPVPTNDGLPVQSVPTNDGLPVQRWLGAKVRQGFYQQPYYLVPKYQGRGTAQNTEGIRVQDTWQLSFSNLEAAILIDHGLKKTCCEADGDPCCRLDCLRLLRLLLHWLTEGNATLRAVTSYPAKTTLLHACCSQNRDNNWRISDLGKCFLRIVDDFANCLERGELFNFFIPTQNLLSDIGRNKRKQLARQIRAQRDQGFPLFQ